MILSEKRENSGLVEYQDTRKAMEYRKMYKYTDRGKNNPPRLCGDGGAGSEFFLARESFLHVFYSLKLRHRLPAEFDGRHTVNSFVNSQLPALTRTDTIVIVLSASGKY